MAGGRFGIAKMARPAKDGGNSSLLQAAAEDEEKAFAESIEEDKKRQREQRTFGDDSFRMMLCGPQMMIKDMRGKDGKPLVWFFDEEENKTYLYDRAKDGDGCQIYTNWTTFECKAEDTLRESVLKLLQSQPLLAETNVPVEELVEKMEGFWVMDENMYEWSDGWYFAVPMRKGKSVGAGSGNQYFPIGLDQLDTTMNDIRTCSSYQPDLQLLLLAEEGGGERVEYRGANRLRVELKSALKEWPGDISDFWPLTKKYWSEATKAAINKEWAEQSGLMAALEPKKSPRKSSCCVLS